MPAVDVVRLACTCLSRRGDELDLASSIAVLPTEQLFGKADPTQTAAHYIHHIAMRLRGLEQVPDEAEIVGIMEIERELDELYGFSRDKESLNRVWRQYGTPGYAAKMNLGEEQMRLLGVNIKPREE